MARTKRHDSESKTGLNLVPIMALLVVLIPVLLVAFTFVEIRVQAANAPKHGRAVKTKPQPKPFQIEVVVTDQGFEVRTRVDGQPQPTTPIALTSAAAHDYPALYTALVPHKIAYPKVGTITVSAAMNVQWHVLAKTMDTVRDRLERDTYADAASLRQAKRRSERSPDGGLQSVGLYPHVVFGLIRGDQ